ANKAAHRGTDPVESSRSQARNQREHVGYILRNDVMRRINEPVGLATPYHVGAHHTVVWTQGTCQLVEIPARPRQTVHTKQDLIVIGVAPLPVGHAVRSDRTRAGHVIKSGREPRRYWVFCHRVHTQWEPKWIFGIGAADCTVRLLRAC